MKSLIVMLGGWRQVLFVALAASGLNVAAAMLLPDGGVWRLVMLLPLCFLLGAVVGTASGQAAAARANAEDEEP